MPNPKTRLDDAVHLYLGANTEDYWGLGRVQVIDMGGVDRGCAPQTMPEAIAKWRRQEIRREKGGRVEETRVVPSALAPLYRRMTPAISTMAFTGAFAASPTKPRGTHAEGTG